MKFHLHMLLARSIPFLLAGSALASHAVIPLPSLVKENNAPGYLITDATSLVASGDAASEVQLLAGRLRTSTGLALPVRAKGEGISFVINSSLKDRLGEEGYLLESSEKGVRIAASGRAGIFYAGQTLLQLLPAEACSPKPISGLKWLVPATSIEDKPRFGWRGFMLDESRQFFGMEHVKKQLDLMALYKLNRFHWHLTDNEGWRIEIKGYPKLTSVGAWRGSETPLPNPRGETHKRYGGFYTQEQLREVVAYAKVRHIEIMPEVDMPGHALAVVASYPEVLPERADGEKSTGNVMSPAKEETYKMVETIFEELKSVFPFGFYHIGGDEVNHNHWKECPQIAKLMEKEKLANFHEVQVYFTRRVEKILASHGKKIFGWHEVMDDRLDRGTGIMSWRSPEKGYEAARDGFPVVLAPNEYFYFDMDYPGAAGEPPCHWEPGPIDIKRVYSFDPMAKAGDLSNAAKARILGVHSAVWSEYVYPWKSDVLDLPTYTSHADYKTWPRLAVFAEVAWTPQESRNYQDFVNRLGLVTLRRLGFLGVNYRIPVPTATQVAGMLTIHPPFPGADVRYTLDGSIPDESSLKADGIIKLADRDPALLRSRTFLDGRGSTMLVGTTPHFSAEWTAGQLYMGNGLFEFDLTSELTEPGTWDATFHFTSGAHAVNISEVEILIDGVSVAKDPHAGRAGSRNVDSTWRLIVPSVADGAKVSLRARMVGDGGKNSNGTISLQKVIDPQKSSK